MNILENKSFITKQTNISAVCRNFAKINNSIQPTHLTPPLKMVIFLMVFNEIKKFRVYSRQIHLNINKSKIKKRFYRISQNEEVYDFVRNSIVVILNKLQPAFIP